jgi:hypothetical protein
MRTRTHAWLRSMALLLGSLTSLFVGLFALDATGAVDTLVHLVPMALLLGMLAVAWRWPALGGAAFIAAAGAYALAAWDHPTWIAAIAGPLLAVGVLFVLSRPPGRPGAVRA